MSLLEVIAYRNVPRRAVELPDTLYPLSAEDDTERSPINSKSLPDDEDDLRRVLDAVPEYLETLPVEGRQAAMLEGVSLLSNVREWLKKRDE